MQSVAIRDNLVSKSHEIGTELLLEASSQIPGSVHYSIKRFARPKNWIAEDVGVFHYQYQHSDQKQNFLELKFCSIGNMYCRRDAKECSQCKANVSFNCEQKTESVDFLSFVFSSSLLEQFIGLRTSNHTLSEGVVCFKKKKTF
jgi:hypothetical protein